MQHTATSTKQSNNKMSHNLGLNEKDLATPGEHISPSQLDDFHRERGETFEQKVA